MQIRPDQLPAALKKLTAQTLPGLLIVSSDEALLLLETVDTLRHTARQQGYTERQVLTVERGFDWNQCQQAQQSMSLFGDRKLIELRIPTGKPGKEGSAVLQDIAKHAAHNPDTLWLITLPRLDRATREGAWFKALEAHGMAWEIPAVEHTQLPNWIAARLHTQQQSASPDALEFLANRVEGNLLAAHQEILKLGLLYPTGNLTLEQIQEAVLNVARFDVFKLSEAVLQGDATRTLRMLRGLHAEGEAPVLVHWALNEDIRAINQLHTAQQQGRAAQTMRDLRIWGAREQGMQQLLRRLPVQAARQAVHLSAQIDQTNKGLSVKTLPQDTWLGLEKLALRLAKR